jgi:hypothetical protein
VNSLPGTLLDPSSIIFEESFRCGSGEVAIIVTVTVIKVIFVAIIRAVIIGRVHLTTTFLLRL